MATYEVRQGDAATVGPCYAKLSDDTAINLTGAKIWASVALSRSATPAVTKKNAAGGGGVTQVPNPADPPPGGACSL